LNEALVNIWCTF